MRIPARFTLGMGDLVFMPLPDEPTPDYIAPGFPPMVPALQTIMGSNVYTSGSPGNTVPSYTDGIPPTDIYGDPGGPFTPGLPNGGLPFTRAQPGERVNPYQRQPIIPNALLPKTLQYGYSVILEHAANLLQINGWDQCIFREADLWTWIRNHGGLKSCCRIPELGAPIYAVPPFLEMPSNGVVERQIFSQPITAFQTAGVFNGTDTVIGQWQVPKGYDGSLTHFLAFFTGDGFLDGSGSITWRLKIGQRFAKNLGNVTFTYGDLKTALLVPGESIRVISGQTITIFGNIAAGAPVSGGRVFGGTLGWTYPRR